MAFTLQLNQVLRLFERDIGVLRISANRNDLFETLNILFHLIVHLIHETIQCI